MLVITAENSNKTVNIPDKWEELTESQFIETIKIVLELEDGTISVRDAKIRYIAQFIMMPLYDITKEETKIQELFFDNLFVISEKIDFFFKNKNGVLSENCNFLFNPIEKIRTESGKLLTGKKFSIKDFILQTNITAEEFIDSLEYFNIYLETQNDRYIDYLCSVFYRDTETYESFSVQKNADDLQTVPKEIKICFFLFFRNFIEFLTQKTHYSVLWSSKNTQKQSKNSVNSMIFALSEYDSVTNIKKMNILEFLDLMLIDMKTNISNLKAQGMAVNEIAEKTNIGIETIIELLK